MFIRLFLPAIAWLALMSSFFFRHYGFDQKWNWGGFTNDSVMHGVLFLGNTHIWIVIFKKQLYFQYLKENAIKLAFILGIAMIFVVESIRYLYSFSNYFNYWNVLCDIIGVSLGIGIFRLVYRRCC